MKVAGRSEVIKLFPHAGEASHQLSDSDAAEKVIPAQYSGV